MHVKAHAKINWDLRVLGKRPDGFHELDSVMVTVGLADTLTVLPGDDLALTCSDPALPCDRSNLVWKAASELAAEAGVAPRARIHLEKRVPMGGGMGGGSSDAAATLRALNCLWNLNWPRERLAAVAARLGSDVAYFLWGGWCLCQGRGERVQPLPGAETLPAVRLFLIIPAFGVPTPPVYAALHAANWDGNTGHRGLTKAASDVNIQVNEAGRGLTVQERPANDLLRAAQTVEPRLVALGELLEARFPGHWRMSGSGAVHFALPGATGSAEGLQADLAGRLPYAVRVVETETVAGGGDG